LKKTLLFWKPSNVIKPLQLKKREIIYSDETYIIHTF
jgi:hypothetical protein